MTLAHITLATRDLAKTKKFFESAFGWLALDRPGNARFPGAWLQIAPGQELHLVEVADFEPSAWEGEYARHIAFFHPLADFQNLQERLTNLSAELIVPQRQTAFQRFFFRDPNGYIFEVVEKRQD